jgi:hypothetical protein
MTETTSISGTRENHDLEARVQFCVGFHAFPLLSYLPTISVGFVTNMATSAPFRQVRGGID